MPPIFPNAPFNPPTDQAQTPGEVAAQQARLILASISPEILATVAAAARDNLKNDQPPDDASGKKVRAKLTRKIDQAPDFFVKQMPTAAKMAEFLLLLELPFHQLKQPRQRAEIKGGFDTAAMYLLLARPNLLGYGVNSAVAELRIQFTRPGPTRRQFEHLARQQAQAIRSAPENAAHNAGWNDFYLGRYLMLGKAQDLAELVARYQGKSPAKVKNRQMITLTARWMINSFMQQHAWFARAFETAWNQHGDGRALPILPEPESISEMFIDEPADTPRPN